MKTVVTTRQIAASPAAVWAVLSDFANIAEWADNVGHSCLQHDGPVGTGSTRRVQVGSRALLETIETWDEGNALSYVIDGLPEPAGRIVNQWVLSERGTGTDVSLTTTIDPGGPPPRAAVVGGVLGRVLAKQSESMLEGLDRHLTNIRLANGTAR
ncbi:MAG TPA: SRPBCC family protein [Acidimicrobiales bacterium]|nr:SRPBCC family protein [Acidimicrobiales bacterium]